MLADLSSSCSTCRLPSSRQGAARRQWSRLHIISKRSCTYHVILAAAHTGSTAASSIHGIHDKPATHSSPFTQPSIPSTNPFDQPDIIYKDSLVSRALIHLMTVTLADAMYSEGQDVYVPTLSTYDDMVRVSRAVMKGRTPEAQAELVRRCMKKLWSEQAAGVFRVVAKPSQWSAEVCASIASSAFTWLVGESSTVTGLIQQHAVDPTDSLIPGHSRQGFQQSVVDDQQQPHIQNAVNLMPVNRLPKSTVLIKRCRYLEASGCVAICTNLCKAATQRFFHEDLGMPLHMSPDFTNLSCRMIFGEVPPPPQSDPAYQQPCYSFHAAKMRPDEPCRRAVTPPSWPSTSKE